MIYTRALDLYSAVAEFTVAARLADGRVPLKRYPSSARLWVECVAIYGLLPILIWAFGRGRPLLPMLWVCALPAGLYLVSRDQRARLGLCRWKVGVWPVARVLLRAAVVAAVLTLLLWRLEPDWLFLLPRTRPGLWALIMVFYPLVSVYPQGLLYRALFFERYARLWGGRQRALAASALVFGLAHLVFGNAWAVLFTLVGGWWFADTYIRSRSLILSCLEHALYGQLVFTIGWGRFLYHGTQVLVESL